MHRLVGEMSHPCSMTAALVELPKVNGRHRNKALAAARRVRAVELKAAGYTYSQVANELGYTSRGTAYNVVAKALREQTTEAVTDLRDLENARLGALQHALWDAAMTGDVRSATAIVKIVKARVHLNGLEPARDGFGVAPRTPRTVVVPPTS
jgi:outer membrane PBP1 activator LpoA protein